MKKFYRIAVLVLIFCLCFTTAVFGAGEGQAAADTHQHLFRCGKLPFAPGHEFQMVTLDDVAWRSGEYSGTPITEKIPSKYPHFDTPSETPLLVLVLEFNNMKYQNNYDWGDTIFNGDLSLAQYYKDNSFNQFSFVPAKETSAYNVGGNHNTKDKANDGVVHITVNADHGCRDLEDETEDMKWINCLVEGIKKADAYVDFSSFDKNNDGEITTDEMALAVVVAGYEASFDGSLSQGENYYLWSHAWNIGSAWYYYFQDQYADWEDFLPCPDGVYVDSYISISEQLEPGWQEPISVLAHELGHYLGLPDLYDTRSSTSTGTWRNYTDGYLTVMCDGSWGYNETLENYYPVNFDAWSKCCLGWVKPQVATNGIYDVTSCEGDAYNVLLVETGVEGEYYLLENREFKGWDESINIVSTSYPGYSYGSYTTNGGLVCWHIDDTMYDQYDHDNAVNNGNHRPAVMPLYPEAKSGKVTFIGSLTSNSTARPFFTYDIWNRDYASTMDDLNFPMYNGASAPSGRSYSDVHMTFLPTTDAHAVKVQFSGLAEHEHTLVKVDAKDATFQADGNIEYWMCTGCNRYFADAEGTEEISAEDVVIPKLGFTVQVNGREITDIEIVDGGYDASYADWTTGDMIEEYLPLAIVRVPEGTETAKITLNNHVDEYHTYYYTVPTEEQGSSQYLDNGFGVMEDVGGMQAPVAHAGVAYDAVVSDEQVIRVQTKYDSNWYSKNLYAILFEYVEENQIIRLSGQDRYDTAIAAAEELKEVNGWDDFQKIIVASGADFPDALSASYLSYVKDAPILLVGKDDKSIAKVTSYINENLASGGTVYIVGGTGAVLESVEDAINGTEVRLAGSDRFATNLEVLKEAGVDGEELLIASGMNYADALSASAAARPIFLVGKTLTKDQQAYLEANKNSLAEATYVIGGPGAVADSVKAEVEAYTGEAKRLEGSDRFATSVAVANEFFPGDIHNMVIASGLAFPDGLSGGPVAIAYDAPLVLVGNNWVDHATNLFVTKKARTLIVMGGKGAVSQAIAETIAAPAKETA